MPTATDTGSKPKARPFADPELVPDLAAFIKRYVILPSDDHAIILALWVIHTWTWESAHVRTTPYLYVHSEQPQCGKTLLMEVVETLACNPMRMSSVTSAALFRAIDTYRPSLLWDEVDTVFGVRRNEQMRNIINSGYKRGLSVVRIHQGEPRKYDPFCPKLLAGIFNGFLPETITDRSIPFKLKRRTKDQHVERFYQYDVARSPEVDNLLERLEAFAKEWSRDLRMIRPEPIESIKDRQWEITEPLVALGACFGAEERTRKACVAMFQSVKEAPSPEAQLFADLREIFEGEDQLFTEDICALLGPTWNGKQLGIWLEPYGIFPQRIRIRNQQRRGYKAEQFKEVW